MNLSVSQSFEVTAMLSNSSETARFYAEGPTGLRGANGPAARHALLKTTLAESAPPLPHRALSPIGYQPKAPASSQRAAQLSDSLPPGARQVAEPRSIEASKT